VVLFVTYECWFWREKTKGPRTKGSEITPLPLMMVSALKVGGEFKTCVITKKTWLVFRWWSTASERRSEAEGWRRERTSD